MSNGNHRIYINAVVMTEVCIRPRRGGTKVIMGAYS